MPDLHGHTALIISTNYGTERDEIKTPLKHLRDAGAQVTVAAPKTEPIQTLEGDRTPSDRIEVTQALSAVDPARYDIVVVPGGTINADGLRRNADAQRIVAAFARAGKPIAAICHAPWLLVESGLAKGKTLTSYVTVSTDVTNGGGTWVDRSVVEDASGGWPLITSRFPADLPDFLGAIDRALAPAA